MARLPTMEDELIKCPELKLDDVQALRDWASKQPHLPNIDDIPDVFLSLFLRRRYYSLERAKQTLDEYLTLRTHQAELFCDRRSDGPEPQSYLETHLGGPLAKRDHDGNVIFWISVRDDDPSKYNFDYSMKTWTMVGDAWAMENGSANGVTLVFDQKNFTMGHMLRMSIATVQKMNYYNKHCAPLSIKSIYAVNATSFTHKIMTYFQPFIDSQIFGKIKVFTSSQKEEFYKHIPREQVPKEFGGDSSSLEDLTQSTVEMVKRHDSFLAKLDSLKVDEKKRTGPSNNMNTIFGLEGTFKKLNVD